MFVPDAVRSQFPEIVELLLASESMKDEERQYWLDILPLMTKEQVEQLHTILRNEREQLAAIDAAYAAAPTPPSAEDLAARQKAQRKHRAELHSHEVEHEEVEQQTEEEILKKIDSV